MDLDSIESSNAYKDPTEKNCQIHLTALDKNIVTHFMSGQEMKAKVQILPSAVVTSMDLNLCLIQQIFLLFSVKTLW